MRFSPFLRIYYVLLYSSMLRAAPRRKRSGLFSASDIPSVLSVRSCIWPYHSLTNTLNTFLSLKAAVNEYADHERDETTSKTMEQKPRYEQNCNVVGFDRATNRNWFHCSFICFWMISKLCMNRSRQHWQSQSLDLAVSRSGFWNFRINPSWEADMTSCKIFKQCKIWCY